jgi:hypothetical protein
MRTPQAHETLLAVKTASLTLQEALVDRQNAVAEAAPDLAALEQSRKTVAAQLREIRGELRTSRKLARETRQRFDSRISAARMDLDQANVARRAYLEAAKRDG